MSQVALRMRPTSSNLPWDQGPQNHVESRDLDWRPLSAVRIDPKGQDGAALAAVLCVS